MPENVNFTLAPRMWRVVAAWATCQVLLIPGLLPRRPSSLEEVLIILGVGSALLLVVFGLAGLVYYRSLCALRKRGVVVEGKVIRRRAPNFFLRERRGPYIYRGKYTYAGKEYKLRLGTFFDFDGSVIAALAHADRGLAHALSAEVAVRALIDPLKPERHIILPFGADQDYEQRPSGKTEGQPVQGERIRQRLWTRDDVVLVPLLAIMLAFGWFVGVHNRIPIALAAFALLCYGAARLYGILRYGAESLVIGDDRLQILNRLGQVTLELPYASIKDLKLVKYSRGLLPARRVAVWCTKNAAGNQEAKEQQDWDYMLANYDLSPQAVLKKITTRMGRCRRDAGGG